MIDFVVKRLSMFPESKKAVIVFPNNKDYQAVLAAPKDDYLPCIVSVQFRLLNHGKGFIMNTIFHARSIDAFQKSHGNITAIALLSEEVAKRLEKNLGKPVKVGPLNGMITDAHIYDETIEEAKKVLKAFKKDGN
ncbi:MAG: thymidylate synthase [Nanoarchaeota archaeon]|nr:thymidylate synthase [Nanoarchaeota archaeon]